MLLKHLLNLHDKKIALKRSLSNFESKRYNPAKKDFKSILSVFMSSQTYQKGVLNDGIFIV